MPGDADVLDFNRGRLPITVYYAVHPQLRSDSGQFALPNDLQRPRDWQAMLNVDCHSGVHLTSRIFSPPRSLNYIKVMNVIQPDHFQQEGSRPPLSIDGPLTRQRTAFTVSAATRAAELPQEFRI